MDAGYSTALHAVRHDCPMKRLPALFSAALSLLVFANLSNAADAIPATSADGRVLNLGFEDGTLRDGRRRWPKYPK